MASNRPTPAVSADLPEAGATDLPLDHALSLLLADETENALRWGAAVLESGPWTPSALVVTARLLDQMGRRRAAIEGLKLAVQQAIAEGNLPLAMAAIGDLRTFGAEVDESLDQTAAAFCEGSDRLRDTQTAPLLPQFGEFRPLSPFLTGPALASKAAQIVETVRQTDHGAGEAPSRIAPLPLFSALGKEALHDLLAAFDTVTVPAGHAVIREGEEEAAAYIVARGELEVSRRSSDSSGKPMVLARLGSGAFFGEMALLSQLPGAASVIATRPSILLVARRDALESVVDRHPEVATELAAHCRRQSVANLGWASPVVVAIPPRERATLVEHFETRMFEAGDRLVEAGEEALGLHLIVSGEIGVVANESGERVLLATLAAGETVGEVELVLCKNSVADAVAVRPTATLFLPRDEFFALVQDHPAILHGLYGIAVRRHAETSLALGAGASNMNDEALLGNVPGELAALVENGPPQKSEVVPAEPGPQRITPLGRGTLGLPRVSPPPPRTASVPPPLPAPPQVPRSPLPPPPASPPVSRVATSHVSTLPPVPASPRRSEAPARTSLPSSVAPMTATAASVRTLEKPGGGQQRMAGIALAAIAAGALGFLTVRGLREGTPAAQPAATAATLPATQELPSSPPPPAVTALPEVTPKPVVKKMVAAQPAAPKVKVVVEPNPVHVASAAPAASPASPSSATPSAAAAAPQPPPQPSRPTFAAAKPAGDQAVGAGEFGGRE
ncbi:MAG TPA: cyclic nucleotide-binding domain-containing protein [Polyangiaceae bacterium]|nr:cyclic nucleotide-binding domain-containing protein [Polyangiaceae bacterium]